MKSLPQFKYLYSSKFSRVYFLRTFKHLGLRVYVQIQKCLQRLHKWLLQPKKCANTIMSVTTWGMYRYKNICYNLKDIRIQNIRYILRYVLLKQCLLQSERRRMNTSMSVTVWEINEYKNAGHNLGGDVQIQKLCYYIWDVGIQKWPLHSQRCTITTVSVAIWEETYEYKNVCYSLRGDLWIQKLSATVWGEINRYRNVCHNLTNVQIQKCLLQSVRCANTQIIITVCDMCEYNNVCKLWCEGRYANKKNLLQSERCMNTKMSDTHWEMYEYKIVCYSLRDMRIQKCLLQSEICTNTKVSVTVWEEIYELKNMSYNLKDL